MKEGEGAYLEKEYCLEYFSRNFITFLTQYAFETLASEKIFANYFRRRNFI